MHFLYTLLYSTLIFLCLFIPWRIWKVKQRRKIINGILNEKIKNWKITMPPENETYIIIKGKEIQINDIIIYLGMRFRVFGFGLGKGAGSFEFGEYVWLEGEFINTNPTDSQPIKRFWLFENTPVVKCINN